ncbi:MAG: Gfo/Idh/MocA family oxidoreductase [Acidobacteria bacterium]|nr:Gfo/Idh/MocA family oxidoreductase [Acidobacteriota bacterium]
MAEEVIRFGLVGAGGIAQAYAQAFKNLKIARLVGVADVNVEAARKLGEQIGCRSYDSYEALGDEWPLDAVIICTPPVSHPEIALHFCQRKVHVLCEKPLSIDVSSAELMLDTARRCGVKLTMASKFRYVEDVVRAKSIVRSGILGDILLIENAFTSRIDMSTRWNSQREISGGGVLIDNGTHSADIMRYFLGPVSEVQVIEGVRAHNLAVEECAQVFVRSSDGVLGRIDLSWSINKELESYINIHGTKGTVVVGWKSSKYRQNTSNEWIVFGNGYDKVQAFRSNIINFCGGIRGEEALLVTPQDAIASVEVIEAAYTALARNQWTKVSHALDQNYLRLVDQESSLRKIA